MLIDQAGIARLIPHSGAMVLIDGVLEWDSDHIRCRATSHRDLDNPLRDGRGLPCLSGIEYAAQAMATHGALVSQKGPGPPAVGYLANVRDLACFTEWLDTAPVVLEIWAQCLFQERLRSLYQFTLSGDGVPLLSGRAAVVYAPVGDMR